VKQKKLWSLLFTILLVIMGCSNTKQIQSFSLSEIPSNARSEEPALLYLVAPEGNENKVIIFTSTISDTRVEATPPVTYDLENADGVQYQFFSEDIEEE